MKSLRNKQTKLENKRKVLKNINIKTLLLREECRVKQNLTTTSEMQRTTEQSSKRTIITTYDFLCICHSNDESFELS